MQLSYWIKKVSNFLPLSKGKLCNICNKKVFDFLPLPDYYQKNFKKYGFPYTAKGSFETIDIDHFFCPACYSMDRERLYAWYMHHNVTLSEKDAILDFAPSQSLSKWIKNSYACKYVTADLFMDSVDVKTDIEDMQVFDSSSFNFAICSHVMEHVNNDVKAMAEIFRVLKPGGSAIMMTPILRNFNGVDEDPECSSATERWRRFGQDDHIRLYSQKVFLDRLKSVGFTVTTITEKCFKSNTKTYFGLPDNCNLYIAFKPNQS